MHIEVLAIMAVKQDHVLIMSVLINLIQHLMHNVIVDYQHVLLIVQIKYVLKKLVLTFLNHHLPLLIVKLGIFYVLSIQHRQVAKRKIALTIH